MNYLLVKKEELDKIGFDSRYKETIPDGRVILELSALRLLSGVTPEVIDGRSLKLLIEEQKAEQKAEQERLYALKAEEEAKAAEEALKAAALGEDASGSGDGDSTNDSSDSTENSTDSTNESESTSDVTNEEEEKK